MPRTSRTTAVDLLSASPITEVGQQSSARACSAHGRSLTRRNPTCSPQQPRSARFGRGTLSVAFLWALAAAACCRAFGAASTDVCSVTSVADLVHALTDSQCSILQVEGAGLALKQSQWLDATRSIPQNRLVVSRSLTLRGATPSTVFDCGYLKARIAVRAGAAVHVTGLFLPNCRQPSAPLASGLDIIALGEGAQLTVSNATFEYTVCAPLSTMAKIATATPRPAAVPGSQDVWPTADVCIPGLARGPNCWNESMSFEDFAQAGSVLGPGGARLSRGAVLYLNSTLVCGNQLSEECVAAEGLAACTRELVAALNLTAWDTHDLPDTWPPGEAAAGALQAPAAAGQAPAEVPDESRGAGKLLAIVVPTVCVGLGLLFGLVTLLLWTRRRKTFTPCPAAVKEAYEGAVFVGLSQGSEEHGPSTSGEDGVAAVVVGNQSKGKDLAARLDQGSEFVVEGLWNDSHRYAPSWEGPDGGRVRGNASLTVSNCTSSSAPAIVGILVAGAATATPPPTSTSSRDGGLLLDSGHDTHSIPLNLVLGVDVIVSNKPAAARSTCGSAMLGQFGQEPVAVKVFHRDLLGGSFEELHALKEDIDGLARCQHPNLVALLGSGEAPGGDEVFLLEELLGANLGRVCHEGAGLPLERVLSVALDVALGLAYLHPTIIHRSVQPGSVLLDGAGNAKLADYGLGRLFVACPEAAESVNGTSQYMAPECLRGKTRTSPSSRFAIGPMSDMYSFGVLLWELLSRERPWKDLTPSQVALAVGHQNRRLEMPAGDRFPPKLRKLILQCWEQDPRKRPTAAEAAKRLSHILHQRNRR